MRYEIPKKFPDYIEKSFPDRFPEGVTILENLHDLVFQFPVQLGDEDVLALEITVDRSGSHARFFSDLGHRGAMKTMFRNEFQGCLHDVTTLV
jgi:hypothetical protein